MDGYAGSSHAGDPKWMRAKCFRVSDEGLYIGKVAVTFKDGGGNSEGPIMEGCGEAPGFLA